MSKRHTRREFLHAVGAGGACLALLSIPGCKPDERGSKTPSSAQSEDPRSSHSPSAQLGDVQTFRSRPELKPPTIDVTTPTHGTAPGYVFIASKKGAGQDGPMIIDNLGQLVWFSKDKYATDLKVQTYRGRPVLTWWEGKRTPPGYGRGEYVILDDSYREMTRIRAGNGYQGDLHEFFITERDTALLTIYHETPMDLSSVGGSNAGVVLDGIIQELDIDTGEVLFEWHSLDHVGLEESYDKPPKASKNPFDYFHINSIDPNRDGDLLVSARKTFTVYKIDRESGEIVWRLGGKRSDFEMTPGTKTVYQHDARWHSDGTITIFDNRGMNEEEQSRGIVVRLDENNMIATLVREYTHPDGVFAATQGSMRTLPNSNVFVGWGNEPYFSEFSRDGELLFNASFPGGAQSYRAFRFPWSGQPDDDPAVAVEAGADGEVTVYASWNGATEVTAWQALAGPDPDQLKPVGSAARDGFETAITVNTTEPYVVVRAKNNSGRVLGTSRVVELEN